MEIDLGHFLIREWRRGDEESLVRHANNPHVSRSMRDRFPHPYTGADADWWIAHASAQAPQTDFAIVVDGEAAGGIGFILQEDVSRRAAEIGYWLGEAFWGRGIATDAVRAMTDHIFANFDVCRIFSASARSSSSCSCSHTRQRRRTRSRVVLSPQCTSILDFPRVPAITCCKCFTGQAWWPVN